jgi:hypothetical protein
MKNVLIERAADYRERAAASIRNADEAATEELRGTYVALAEGWTNLADAILQTVASLPDTPQLTK